MFEGLKSFCLAHKRAATMASALASALLLIVGMVVALGPTGSRPHKPAATSSSSTGPGVTDGGSSQSLSALSGQAESPSSVGPTGSTTSTGGGASLGTIHGNHESLGVGLVSGTTTTTAYANQPGTTVAEGAPTPGPVSVITRPPVIVCRDDCHPERPLLSTDRRDLRLRGTDSSGGPGGPWFFRRRWPG